MTYKKWDRVEIFWDDSYMIHGWVRLEDAGKTWYDIDDPKLNNGDTWRKRKLWRWGRK